ncbi:hypothetical protein FIBSPDRAFT_946591 [Athelia psychrophila]|uniref:Uncharacterized protein n=1 Tax=Athelia psychrophila TaxID=1759441 RepID=A0A166SQE4_9AGAM|nr:hypothetical protein FIBSPDRAFT_946591 [Fibularhizoctonia sp. CBS 109695]
MSYALPGAHTEKLDAPARLVDGASCEEDSVQVQQSITDPAYTRPKCDRACMLRSPTGNTAPHTRAQTPPGPTSICTSVVMLVLHGHVGGPVSEYTVIFDVAWALSFTGVVWISSRIEPRSTQRKE